MKIKFVFLATILAVSTGSVAADIDVLTFDQSWSPPSDQNVKVLVVGGGGGGGGDGSSDGIGRGGGAGGGAGGVVYDSDYFASGSVSVKVGDGGSKNSNGEDSYFGSLKAHGGGSGQSGDDTSPTNGGSTGGEGQGGTGDLGNALQPGTNSGVDFEDGHLGGSLAITEFGAGGGGCGEQGHDAKDGNQVSGGEGCYYGDIFGNDKGDNGYFAGGGGGGDNDGGGDGDKNYGGKGGGGDSIGGSTPDDGMDYTGGGGGGNNHNGVSGAGTGGKGVVIVKYDSYVAPEDPVLQSPSDGAIVGLEPELKAFVETGSASDFDYVRFEQGDGSEIATNNNVGTGDTTVTASGYDTPGASYDWQVEANDGTTTVTSNTVRNFQIINNPDKPSLLNYNDGAVEVPLNPNLDIEITHPDSGQTNLNNRFQVEMTSNGNNVNSVSNVDAGQTIQFSPNFDYSQSYDIQVDITDQQEGLSSQKTWTLETVHDVSVSTFSGPSKSPASINPTLEADISHSDSAETVTVDFVNADTGNTISGCSISGIGNGQTATCDTSNDNSFGSSPGTTYNWKVQVSGDRPSESASRGGLSFTTISKPDKPALKNPSPSGTSGVDTANNLRVDVTHPDSENMDVTFRVDENADGNYDQSITKTGIASGDTASANPSLTTGTTYDWYAEVDTADYTTSNSNAANPYSFTTNYGPAVDSVSATNSSSDHAFSSVYGIVSDPDGASDISSATLTVDDGDGNTNSYSSTSIDTSAGTGNEANVTFGSVSYTDVAGWSGNENMQLKIQTTDNDGRSALKDTTRKFPNHAPVVETGFSYTDDPNNHAFTLSIEASDVDAGSSEIASCNVEHSDGTNSFSTSGNLITGEPRSTCKLRIDTSFTGYQKGDVISHNVTFTDQHGKSVTSLTDTHMIPNTAPTASNLEPSGSAVQYGPTIKATYNDADGDTGSITFYNSSSGAQIGSTQTGLTDGTVASVTWGSADTPGTEFNFTAEASDGLNSTNSTQNFTTIFQPKKPFDPFPANNSLVDTTNALNSDVAASVKVVHPDGRDMDVKFINASSGNVIDTDFSVPSGGRAKIDNDQTSLRDETNTTYKWFAQSVDPGTTPPQKKLSSIYNFSTVEVGTIDFDFQTGKNENVDITGNADNGNEEIRIGVESTLLDVIPRILIMDSSGNLIKRFTDVSNNSVISVDVVQDGGQDWNLQTDQAYEWSIAAYEEPNRVNKIRERGPFNLYTYNISTSWDRSTKYYNVFEYDLYRAEKNGDPPYSYEQVGVKADTSFIDAGPELEPGEFCWKVAASNPQGESQRIPSGGECRTLNEE